MEREGRAPSCALLDGAPGREDRDDERSHHPVEASGERPAAAQMDVATAEGDCLDGADRKCCERPDGDERVHARGAVAEQADGGPQEGPPTDHLDGEGQSEHEPAVGAALGTEHCHREGSQPEHPGNRRSENPVIGVLDGLRGVVSVDDDRRVTGAADGSAQLGIGHLGGIEADECPRGREIHRRARDPGATRQRAFHPDRARVAVHASDRELHGRELAVVIRLRLLVRRRDAGLLGEHQGVEVFFAVGEAV